MVYGVTSISRNQEKNQKRAGALPIQGPQGTRCLRRKESACVCECYSKLLFKTIFMNFLVVLFPSFITLNWYLPYSEYLCQLEICVFHKSSSWYQGRQKFLVAKKLFYCF